MLEINIRRVYADRSVTRGYLSADGKIIGMTMECPEKRGNFGACLDTGEYIAKIDCTEWSPYTPKITRTAARTNNHFIPCGDYESLLRGICVGRPIGGELYELKDSCKVFAQLVRKIQEHVWREDRKIKVVITDDPLIERVNAWRKSDDNIEWEEDDDDEEEEDWW